MLKISSKFLEKHDHLRGVCEVKLDADHNGGYINFDVLISNVGDEPFLVEMTKTLEISYFFVFQDDAQIKPRVSHDSAPLDFILGLRLGESQSISFYGELTRKDHGYSLIFDQQAEFPLINVSFSAQFMVPFVLSNEVFIDLP